MMPTLGLVRGAGLLALALPLAACSGSAPVQVSAPAQTAAPGASPVDLDSLWQQVRSLQGDGACQATADCLSLPMGAKACGGPSGYLVVSRRTIDENGLRTALTRHAQAQRQTLEASGRVSDCARVVDPGARCEAGLCVAGPSPQRSPSQ